MAEQLTFDLPARTALGRDAFFVAPSNELAVTLLDTPQSWPSGKLLLIGPKGSGKSHLAQVWAGENAAKVLPARGLKNVETLGPTIVIEDADQMAQADEEQLFHLHNLILAQGGRLLMTATTPPKHWGLTLPDLASRMEGTSVAQISAPDDHLLGMLLVKHFEDRQLTVALPVVEFLIKRMERSAEAVQALVERLDKAALREGKPLTRAFAAQVLANAPET